MNLNLPFTFAITALFSTGRPDSDTIIAQLKDLMAKTTANEAKVKRLNSMSLPQKLLANQNVEIIAYQQQKQLMDQLFIDYADNNKAGLKKDFTAIVTQPTISDSNSFLSFWQTDDTLTAIETLRNEWNTFGEKF